jgi:hypothetical protein
VSADEGIERLYRWLAEERIAAPTLRAVAR